MLSPVKSNRQRQARLFRDTLKHWLERQRVEALLQTPIADALNYALNQLAALTVYVTDGDLAIDNNVAERAIEPFAIGRQNWLFFGSDRGGRTLAILSSVTATCELLKKSVAIPPRHDHETGDHVRRSTRHAAAIPIMKINPIPNQEANVDHRTDTF